MSTASFDNIQPSAGGTARNAVRGIAAAWANLNGTGTIALRDSENVSSVVDNGTGNYTFNFSNVMASLNSSVSCGLSNSGRFSAEIGMVSSQFDTLTKTVTSSSNATPISVDTPYVAPVVYGDLA